MDHLQTVFKLTPAPCLLVQVNSPHFTIDRVNLAYLRATGKTEADLVGKNLLDVLPQNPGAHTAEGNSNLRKSLLTVIHTRDTHQLPVQQYELAANDAPEPDTRYWDLEIIPVLNDKGEVELMMFTVKDVTEKMMISIEKAEAENRYSRLFHFSPLPMWVYETITLKFLDVNSAAISHYGYSREEFLNMSIRDIRPLEEIAKIEKTVRKYCNHGNMYFPGRFRHKKKNGEVIQVDIYSNPILFEGKTAKVVIAHDITERLNYLHRIEDQNKALHEIAWIQSHIVRAPLARIMGCARLLNDEAASLQDRNKLLSYLLLSANEFDQIIRSIVDKTHQLDEMYRLDQSTLPVAVLNRIQEQLAHTG